MEREWTVPGWLTGPMHALLQMSHKTDPGSAGERLLPLAQRYGAPPGCEIMRAVAGGGLQRVLEWERNEGQKKGR